jgi:hypothetical protein
MQTNINREGEFILGGVFVASSFWLISWVKLAATAGTPGLIISLLIYLFSSAV